MILYRYIFNGNMAIFLFFLVVVKFYINILSTLIKL